MEEVVGMYTQLMDAIESNFEKYLHFLCDICSFEARAKDKDTIDRMMDYVAAFCHEGSIRCMLDLVLGQRHCRKDYPLDNGAVSIFEFADGHWTLNAWNVTDA